MIRLEAGMPTSRYCRMLGIPERSYRRWQARARQQRNPLGPWPRPVSMRVEAELVRLAGRWPAWGHRILAQVGRLDHGLAVSDSTAYRVLDRAGLCLPVDYTRERRDLAAARRAAFVEPPTRPHQVWQLDFTEYETTQGGVWRAAGCADYWSKYEYGWQISTTQNQHDAINAVEIAIREAERLSGRPLAETLVDPVTGETKPIRLVTDNGPAFKSHGFARYLTSRPELAHIRTRRASPGQNGVRERAFRSLKYEQLYRHEIPDGETLARLADEYREVFNWIRPHHAISMHRPGDYHLANLNHR